MELNSAVRLSRITHSSIPVGSNTGSGHPRRLSRRFRRQACWAEISERYAQLMAERSTPQVYAAPQRARSTIHTLQRPLGSEPLIRITLFPLPSSAKRLAYWALFTTRP